MIFIFVKQILKKNNKFKTYAGKSVDDILSKLDESHEDFTYVQNAVLHGEYEWALTEKYEET